MWLLSSCLIKSSNWKPPKCVNPHMTINKVAKISPNNHANTLMCQNVGMFPMRSATIEKSRNVINYPLNNFVNMSIRQSAKEYPLVFQSKDKNFSVHGLNIDNIMMILIVKQQSISLLYIIKHFSSLPIICIFSNWNSQTSWFCLTPYLLTKDQFVLDYFFNYSQV